MITPLWFTKSLSEIRKDETNSAHYNLFQIRCCNLLVLNQVRQGFPLPLWSPQKYWKQRAAVAKPTWSSSLNPRQFTQKELIFQPNCFRKEGGKELIFVTISEDVASQTVFQDFLNDPHQMAPAKSRCYIRLYQKATYKLSNCHRNANNHKLPFIFTRTENCVFLVAIGLIHPSHMLYMYVSA